MNLLKLVKTNSVSISTLFLINLVGMSVFCVSLFYCNILISLKISFKQKERTSKELFYYQKFLKIDEILDFTAVSGSRVYI